MTQKRNILLNVFVLASIAAGIIAGMLLKISVDLHMTGYPGMLYSVTGSSGVILMQSYLIAFGFVLSGAVLKTGMKNRQDNCRRTGFSEKLCAQRSEVVSAVEHLQQAYSESEKNYVAKSRFLNRMSHDLRTPMNAIMGYSMLLERCAENPERVSHYAQRIYVSGQTLLELITDALDMSCIESGNIKLVENEFSLLSVLEEVKNSVKPQIEAKNQSFHYYLTNSTGIDWITGDKQRLCQVIRNILSNATKYTQDGGSVEMTVSITEAGNRPQMLCQIKDNGCGMSREFMETVFTPFEREDTELNTSIPGTGLGMCIARSFVELMEGTLFVESEPGSGTLVSVTIPLTPAVLTDKRMRNDYSGGETLKGMRFLAAEDNESNAEILSEVLNAMGAECTIVGDGQAAVEMFEQSEAGYYDIVLMDIQMPIMNGYQAAASIRRSRHQDARDIVIIAMTADAFEEDVQRTFVSGMNAHISKPIDLETFTKTVSSFG